MHTEILTLPSKNFLCLIFHSEKFESVRLLDVMPDFKNLVFIIEHLDRQTSVTVGSGLSRLYQQSQFQSSNRHRPVGEVLDLPRILDRKALQILLNTRVPVIGPSSFRVEVAMENKM